jgi:hypothetical protein
MPELTRRYVVMAMATEAPFDLKNPDEPFVLKPWKDPAALCALRAYRDMCYPELARDLDEWVQTIEAGPIVRGDVGRRNEPHAKPRVPAARPARRKPRRAAVRTGKGKRAAPRAAKKRRR